MRIVKIIDISVDVDLLNISKVAEKAKLSQPYVSQLLNPKNKRKNKESLKAVRDSIIALYKINVAA